MLILIVVFSSIDTTVCGCDIVTARVSPTVWRKQTHEKNQWRSRIPTPAIASQSQFKWQRISHKGWFTRATAATMIHDVIKKDNAHKYKVAQWKTLGILNEREQDSATTERAQPTITNAWFDAVGSYWPLVCQRVSAASLSCTGVSIVKQPFF